MKRRIIMIVLCAAAVLMLTGCNGCNGKVTDNTTPVNTMTQDNTEKHNNGTVTDKDGFIGNDDEENRTTSPVATLIPDMSTSPFTEPYSADNVPDSTDSVRSIF